MSPKLLRRHLEEQIIAVVPIDKTWLDETAAPILNGRSEDECLQEKKGWTRADLDLHLRREEALRRFARQRFALVLRNDFLLLKDRAI